MTRANVNARPRPPLEPEQQPARTKWLCGLCYLRPVHVCLPRRPPSSNSSSFILVLLQSYVVVGIDVVLTVVCRRSSWVDPSLFVWCLPFSMTVALLAG